MSKIKFLVNVSVYNDEERLENLLESCSRSVLPGDLKDRVRYLLVNTGDPLTSRTKTLRKMLGAKEEIIVPNRRRAARDVVYVRFQVARRIVEKESTVLINWDTDYVVNPHALAFTEEVFRDNADIQVASLLKPAGSYPHLLRLKKSGFWWLLADSCMGGSSIYRFAWAAKWLLLFFASYKTNGINTPHGKGVGSFDQRIWPFVTAQTGRPVQIFHLWDFSLVQHCNFISHYVGERKDALHHTWGDCYDPCLNPFEIRKAMEGNSGG